MTVVRYSKRDRDREELCAEFIEATCGCRLEHTKRLFRAFDYRAYRGDDDHPFALVEIKGVADDVFDFPTSYFRIDKYSWMLEAQREEKAPAVMFQKAGDRLGWLLMDEITDNMDEIERDVAGGRADRGEVGKVFNPVFKLPKSMYRLLTMQDQGNINRRAPFFRRFAALYDVCNTRFPVVRGGQDIRPSPIFSARKSGRF